MSYKDFMNNVRYWDNLAAKWMLRHFYFMFFQAVLLIVFVLWFINLFHVIDVFQETANSPTMERALSAQSINTTLIVFLLILNSFWMLYIFNGMQRVIGLLKDVHHELGRWRHQNKP